MSSRSTPAADADERYSPIDRIETRSGRPAELLVVGGTVTGLALANGRPGVVAGLVLLGCWMRLRVELTFVVGAVLVAVIGGDVSAPGSLLAIACLCGLLAIDLARTWTSAQPVALFLASVVIGVIVGVPAYDRVGLYLFALGAVGVLVCVSYGLYRYERYVSRSAVDEEKRRKPTDDRSTEGSSRRRSSGPTTDDRRVGR